VLYNPEMMGRKPYLGYGSELHSSWSALIVGVLIVLDDCNNEETVVVAGNQRRLKGPRASAQGIPSRRRSPAVLVLR